MGPKSNTYLNPKKWNYLNIQFEIFEFLLRLKNFKLNSSSIYTFPNLSLSEYKFIVCNNVIRT